MIDSPFNFASTRDLNAARIELAEGVGFEPTVGCPTLDFESSALNRTQPPFHKIDIVSCDAKKERGNYQATATLCKSIALRRAVRTFLTNSPLRNKSRFEQSW